jgi:hypothetical protein
MVGRQRAGKAQQPRFRFRFNRALTVMCVVVVLGILLVLFEPKHFADAAKGIGEALIIAGVLGLTVDSYLKKTLVREIGTLALRTLFGANAPQEYIDLLSDSLRAVSLVSLVNEYRIRLEDAGAEMLRVISEVRVELVNISTRTWTSVDPQLAASKTGTEPSRFTEYEITTRQPQVGQRAVSSISQSFSIAENREMLSAQVHNKDGVTTLKRELLHGWREAVVAPGGEASIRMKAITLQPRQGGLPFITRTPALSLILRVSGPELANLEVVPYIGSQILRPGESDAHAAHHGDPLGYSYGFVYAQSTLRVEWAPRSARDTNRLMAGAHTIEGAECVTDEGYKE